MTGRDHYRKAEEYLTQAGNYYDATLKTPNGLPADLANAVAAQLSAVAALAQAHATLAHVATVAPIVATPSDLD